MQNNSTNCKYIKYITKNILIPLIISSKICQTVFWYSFWGFCYTYFRANLTGLLVQWMYVSFGLNTFSFSSTRFVTQYYLFVRYLQAMGPGSSGACYSCYLCRPDGCFLGFFHSIILHGIVPQRGILRIFLLSCTRDFVMD